MSDNTKSEEIEEGELPPMEKTPNATKKKKLHAKARKNRSKKSISSEEEANSPLQPEKHAETPAIAGLLPSNPRFFAFGAANPLQKPRFFPKVRKNIHKFAFPPNFRDEPGRLMEIEAQTAKSQGNSQGNSQEIGKTPGFPRQNFGKMRGGGPFRGGNHGFFRGGAQNHGFRAGNYQNFRSFAENPATNAINLANISQISVAESNKIGQFANFSGNVSEKRPKNFVFPPNNAAFSPKNGEFVGNFEKVPPFSPLKPQNFQHFAGFPRENFAKKPMNHANHGNFAQFPGNSQKFRPFPPQNPFFMKPEPYFFRNFPKSQGNPQHFAENPGNNLKSMEILEETPQIINETAQILTEKPQISTEKPQISIEKAQISIEKPANLMETRPKLLESLQKAAEPLKTPVNLSENSQEELEKTKLLQKLNEISGEHREEFVQKLKNLLKTSTSENKGTLEKMVSLFSAKVEEKEEKKQQLANKMQSMGIFLGFSRETKEIDKEIGNFKSKDPRLREKPKENNC